MHYVYILFSPSLSRFYTGETVDVTVRLEQHNNGYYEGASTSITSDWEIFLQIACQDRTEALKLERFIKRQKSSRFIRRLKESPEIIESIRRKI